MKKPNPTSAFLFSLLLVLATGCCFNSSGPGCAISDSSSGDAGVKVDVNASTNFPAVQTILKNQCVQCHAGFGNYSESDWKSSGYVTAGDPADSTLYTKIRGTSLGGQQNMPPASTIPTTDSDTIKSWILGMSSGGTNGGTVATTGAAARLSAVLTILRKTYPHGNSCTSCHISARTATSGAYGGAAVPLFGTFTKDSDFVTSGLIVPGSPSISWIYRALRTYGDIALMPNGETVSISAADAATISDWITNIGNP